MFSITIPWWALVAIVSILITPALMKGAAEEKRKQREHELELARLKAGEEA